MLYTKYKSSGPCSFRQEVFGRGPLDDATCIYQIIMKALELHFENLCLTPWPTYATNQNHLNNFGRRTPMDHSCEVWLKSNEQFQRRRCLSKKVYARRTMHDQDDGQRPVTIAHPEHFVLWWAKKINVPSTDTVGPRGEIIVHVHQVPVHCGRHFCKQIHTEWNTV